MHRVDQHCRGSGPPQVFSRIHEPPRSRGRFSPASIQYEQLQEILDIELALVQQQVLDDGRLPFMFHLTPEAKAFLLREGTDLRYGARHLKRAIARHVVSPLANLLASSQVELGDMVSIDWDDDARCLVFQNQGPAPPDPRANQVAVQPSVVSPFS